MGLGLGWCEGGRLYLGEAHWRREDEIGQPSTMRGHNLPRAPRGAEGRRGCRGDRRTERAEEGWRRVQRVGEGRRGVQSAQGANGVQGAPYAPAPRAATPRYPPRALPQAASAARSARCGWQRASPARAPRPSPGFIKYVTAWMHGLRHGHVWLQPLKCVWLQPRMHVATARWRSPRGFSRGAASCHGQQAARASPLAAARPRRPRCAHRRRARRAAWRHLQ